MKTCILVSLTFTLCVADIDFKRQWESFKAEHGKSYPPKEDQYRSLIFKENILKIHRHNKLYEGGQVSFKVGVNKFADLLSLEIAQRMNNGGEGSAFQTEDLYQRTNCYDDEVTNDLVRPSHIDWREKGFVTAVKDQGECSSGGVFAVIGAIEAQLVKKIGKLVTLSEQPMIDCVISAPFDGCEHGSLIYAYRKIYDQRGLFLNSSYPLRGKKIPCDWKLYNSKSDFYGLLRSVVRIYPDEKDLQDAVFMNGPITTTVFADNWGFHFYESGIYEDEYCVSVDPNHGVLVVGYGTEGKDKDYWIVKNSWGASWGDQGYIKIARNKSNMCAIAKFAYLPIL